MSALLSTGKSSSAFKEQHCYTACLIENSNVDTKSSGGSESKHIVMNVHMHIISASNQLKTMSGKA